MKTISLIIFCLMLAFQGLVYAADVTIDTSTRPHVLISILPDALLSAEFDNLTSCEIARNRIAVLHSAKSQWDSEVYARAVNNAEGQIVCLPKLAGENRTR